MNLTQMKYFLEVAACLNFTAAAERLYVSQQCVSKQIARLEHEIGVRLFDRSTSKVTLTEGGALLRTEWQRLLDSSNQAIASAQALQRTGRPTLRVGLLELSGVLDFVLPQLTAYGKEHPTQELEYEIGSFLQIQEWLFADRVDLIVSVSYELARLPERYQSRNLKPMPLHIVLSKSHPLAAREHLTLADVRGEVFYSFAPEYSSDAVETVLRHCRREGFAPDFKCFNSINAMELALHAGKGINVGFREFYRNQDGDLKFYPLPVLSGYAQPCIAVGWPQENTPRLEEFIRCLSI